MHRAVEKYLEDPLTKEFLRGTSSRMRQTRCARSWAEVSWRNVRRATKGSVTACFRYRRGRDEDRVGQSSLGRASLTLSGRPPNSLPSKFLMAARPSGSLLIVTNAKPRGWPVSRSVMTLISLTLPNCSKIWCRSASVMVNEIFPT
jgi:hypothetical protein